MQVGTLLIDEMRDRLVVTQAPDVQVPFADVKRAAALLNRYWHLQPNYRDHYRNPFIAHRIGGTGVVGVRYRSAVTAMFRELHFERSDAATDALYLRLVRWFVFPGRLSAPVRVRNPVCWYLEPEYESFWADVVRLFYEGKACMHPCRVAQVFQPEPSEQLLEYCSRMISVVAETYRPECLRPFFAYMVASVASHFCSGDPMRVMTDDPAWASVDDVFGFLPSTVEAFRYGFTIPTWRFDNLLLGEV